MGPARVIVLAATVLCGALTASTAGAADDGAAAADAPAAATVEVDLGLDLPITAAAGLVAGGLFLNMDALVHARCAPDCDEQSVNPLDRPVAGTYSRAASTAGDVVAAVNLTLPHALGAIDAAAGHHPEGWWGYGEDTLILAETLAVSLLVHQSTTFVAQRPRPLAYAEHVDDDRRFGANAYVSFYSGHTANSFALATAYSYLFGIRHPSSPLRGGVWALTHGLAAVDGYLRVVSGYHFPSDVIVGAAVGSGIGLLIPWLHTTAADAAPAGPDSAHDGAGSGAAVRRTADRRRGPQVMVLPTATAGGAGLGLVLF